MSISAPPYMPMAWGSGTGANVGVINSAIWTTFTSAAPGNASLNDGFPIQQMAPSGTPPQGGDMNAILNWITTFQTWVNAGGRFLFNSALCTAIGGYPIGMVLQLVGRQVEVVAYASTSVDPNTLTLAQLAVGNSGWILYAGNASTAATANTMAIRDLNGYLNAVRFVGSGAGLSTATIPPAALAGGSLPANVSLGNSSFSNANGPSSTLTVAFGATKMMGWGASPSSVSFTPNKSGRVLIISTGIVSTSVSTAQGSAYFYYGTGAAPANNANATGTMLAVSLPGWGSGTWSASQTPWTGVAMLTGLAPGTTYWLDVAVSCGGSSGNAYMQGISFSVIEI